MMEVASKGKAKRKHLSAGDCKQLAQNADSLTQPHTSNHGLRHHDHNQRLHPRTPRKRRCSAAPASQSPSGKQRAINDYYCVSKVISSSPQKSSLPSTSTVPKEGSKLVEEEHDDDDESLLSTPFEYEPKAEDEVDDDCLLAAENCPFEEASTSGARMIPERDGKAEDYLEGMTAEMFGADGEFDECCNQEEEVEPLPDAHFGLMGSSKALLQPQGCMDDLPEEVLRQVLCQVPAADLYRNVSLVCHRWRNIVQDPTFVPFKKQYFRYTMREKEMVLEVNATLRNSNIRGPPPSEHSLRNLVVLMAQHKAGERVRPEDVLECVKKHRLFPQAEASIRLRIPDIKKFLHLDIEGPNPYAAMAVILILSECVGDVQALVSLLSGCVSQTSITEYLSHMAMMLLALERNGIHISNRLHYNIYYVLHLLENGPFSVRSDQTGCPQVQLTREQQQILSHDIQPEHVVKIIAFAGTGKTTTLIKYAELRPHIRFLYVAFNSSVASEARRRFPSNVDCKTVHSLAYRDVGWRYKPKMTPNLYPFSINFALPAGRGGFVRAKVIATTLSAFMASADPTISTRHVPFDYVTHKGRRTVIDSENQQLFAQDAQTIWGKMTDINEKSKRAYYMTHNGYMKLWQLSNPKRRLSDQYDVIFLDEAQDCTPAIMDVLLSQRCGKILVGDPHQQIYTFRGAVNALTTASHTHIFYLTQSFRFGAEIAYVGATILKVCKGVQKILVGGKQEGGVCDEMANKALEAMRTGVSSARGKIGILSRCNSGVFKGAVQLTDANPNCRIHFIGGVENAGLDKIMDVYHLMTQESKNEKSRLIKDAIIRSFSMREDCAFLAFKKYVTQTDDKELDGKVIIVEKYQKRIPELVARLKGCSEVSLHEADFTVGTVHKAKGLEFDTVIINDDFAYIPTSGHNLSRVPDFSFSRIPADEWNLLYVAVTRARTSLVLTKNILRILTVAKEYFLTSQVSMEAGSAPLPCSISDCPNCITPGSAFTMSKQSFKCTDRVTSSGPLCEKCVWTRIGPTAFLMTDEVFSMADRPERLEPPIHYPFFMALFF
uniref:F-box DNA helicase 1 n=3 Tax=Nothobranchius kuhntae TaxID=321403 RepID=A0A1A8HT58_NOTKU